MAKERVIHEDIDINIVNVEDLASIPGIGRNEAEEIVHYRDEHGFFENWDELKDIPGMTPDMIEGLKQKGVRLEPVSFSI